MIMNKFQKFHRDKIEEKEKRNKTRKRKDNRKINR